MGKLFSCGICCMILSIWAIVQLSLMGVFFKIEALAMIRDAEAEEYDDYADFMKKTKANYSALARNCWITAAIYLLMLILSIVCVKKAKCDDRKLEAIKTDDELACSKHLPPAPSKKKSSKKMKEYD